MVCTGQQVVMIVTSLAPLSSQSLALLSQFNMSCLSQFHMLLVSYASDSGWSAGGDSNQSISFSESCLSQFNMSCLSHMLLIQVGQHVKIASQPESCLSQFPPPAHFLLSCCPRPPAKANLTTQVFTFTQQVFQVSPSL